MHIAHLQTGGENGLDSVSVSVSVLKFCRNSEICKNEFARLKTMTKMPTLFGLV